MKHAARFFEYARKRHQITLDRAAGKPEPWTKDKILYRGRFCSVFREDDRTTRWFRDNVRERMRADPRVLLATVVFRMFNRIQTGEAIFSQTLLPSSRFKKNDISAFDVFCTTGDPAILRSAILALMPKGPYCTGAYIISSPPGYTKLEGVLEILARFYQNSEWRHWVDNDPASNECSLEAVWEWLKEQDYLGKFHSYEIVTDLRHTELLCRAPDIMTWANPGPGARRGMNRVMGYPFDSDHMGRDELIEEMRTLLSLAGDARLWPRGQLWPRWELREVEHTLCEFDKYERIRLGQGRMKGRFR